MSKLLAVVAFLVLAGFLGILFFEVPQLELGIVLGVTLAFAAWDLWRGQG